MQLGRAQIPVLTGMRGIAILLVLANHFAPRTAPFDWSTAPFWVRWLFGFSDYGMTLFFTLSGFVIAYNYLNLDWRSAPGRSAWTFAVHRISRLYPTLLAFILLAGIWRHAPVDWVKALIQLAPVNTWVPLPFDYSIGSSYNVSWSISTEIGLYIAFALAMLTLSGMRSKWVSATFFSVAGVLAIAFIALGARPDVYHALTRYFPAILPLDERTWRIWFFYLSPYYRAIQFALGAAAAFCVLRQRPILVAYQPALQIGAAASVVGLTLLKLSFFVTRIEPALSDFAASILFAVIMLNSTDDTLINRLLGSAALVFVGEISYSLYLFQNLSTAAVASPSPGTFSFSLIPLHWLNLAICFGFAIAFSTGSYQLLEVPTRRILRRSLLARRTNHSIPAAAPMPAE